LNSADLQLTELPKIPAIANVADWQFCMGLTIKTTFAVYCKGII
jgi:hypothetical protein